MKSLATAALCLGLPLCCIADDTVPRARAYTHNCDVQLDWTASVTQSLDVPPYGCIMHYGCRNAEYSAQVLPKVPGGYVLALDSNTEFRHWAARKYPDQNFPNLVIAPPEAFTEEDISQTAFRDNPVPITDAIVCVDQIWREEDPEATLYKFHQLLREDGKVYLSQPVPKMNNELDRTLRQVYTLQGVDYPFDDAKLSTVDSLSEITACVKRAGFDPVDGKLVEGMTAFADRLDFENWLYTWLASDSNIALDGLQQSVKTVVAAYLDRNLSAQRSDGSIWIAMHRIELIATRTDEYQRWTY